MKVLFIDKSKIFAGAEYSLSSLIEGLRNLSVNSVICADYPLQHHEMFKSRKIGIIYRNKALKWWMGRDYSLKAPRGSDFIKRILFGIQLLSIIKDQGIKLIHINLLRDTDRIDIIFAKLAGCRVIGHVRSLQGQARIHKSTLNLCSRIICTSDFVLSEINANGCKTSALRIYNPIDVLSYSQDGVNLKDLRLKYGVPTEFFTISSIAILDPRKGHDTAILAFSKVSKEISNSILLIAGGASGMNDEKARLVDLVKRLGLEDKVIFLGHVNTIREVYAMSDIILALSKDGEAFGRIPLEAAGARKVTIATNIGAASEIIDNNKTGILVDPEDYTAVADYICKLLRSEELMLKLKENAFNNAISNFGTKSHAMAVLEVYRMVPTRREKSKSTEF